MFQSQPGQIVPGEPVFKKKKKITEIGLEEWLKVKALRSSPVLEKKKIELVLTQCVSKLFDQSIIIVVIVD
jgi:hypothetical protein